MLSCFVVISPASAYFVTGNDLYDHCKQEPPHDGFCIGYVAAMYDIMTDAFLTAGSINAGKLCVSDDVQLGRQGVALEQFPVPGR